MSMNATQPASLPMVPFHVTWRLTPRGAIVTGIRYGTHAEAVRTSLLAALREYHDKATVCAVLACDRAMTEHLGRFHNGRAITSEG